MAHLVAGEWQDAGWAAEKVLQQHRKESCPRSLGRRMLSEAHFERERRISPPELPRSGLTEHSPMSAQRSIMLSL